MTRLDCIMEMVLDYLVCVVHRGGQLVSHLHKDLLACGRMYGDLIMISFWPPGARHDEILSFSSEVTLSRSCVVHRTEYLAMQHHL